MSINMKKGTQKRKCPKCGSKNVSITRNTYNHIKENICQDCGKSWFDKTSLKIYWLAIGGALLFVGLIFLLAFI